MLDLRPHTPSKACWTSCFISPEQAIELAPRFAQLNPWKKLQFTPGQLRSTLSNTESGQFCQIVLNKNHEPMAAFIIWPKWLFGPYLQFLAVLPEFQNQGIATAVLSAFEDEAKMRQARNLWVVTSSDNEPAQKIYRRHGFAAVAAIDGLILDSETEILFRKRLH